MEWTVEEQAEAKGIGLDPARRRVVEIEEAEQKIRQRKGRKGRGYYEWLLSILRGRREETRGDSTGLLRCGSERAG